MIYWPWRAGAEQEGEEDEGHFIVSNLCYSKTAKPRLQTPDTVAKVPPLLLTIANAKVQKPTRSATVLAPAGSVSSESGVAIVNSNLHELLPLLLSGVQVKVCVIAGLNGAPEV